MTLNTVSQFAAWSSAVDAVLLDEERDAVAFGFDDMDDLESYTLRRDGRLTARKVA